MWKWGLKKWHKVRLKWSENKIVYNYFQSKYKKRALIIYVVAPFKIKLPPSHQNLDQVIWIAREFDAAGFQVDIINFDGPIYKLKYKYNCVLDVHPGRNNYEHLLEPNARKIAYITGSNPSFANKAEENRIHDVFQKKGVLLSPRRFAPPFQQEVFNTFHDFFYIGDTFNIDTYQNLKLPPVSFIVNNGYPELIPQIESHKPTRRFLFLASWGQVHKGLDLLLDVFTQHPEWHLHICSRYAEEKDFYMAYLNELSNFENIHTHGFQDIRSSYFREIAAQCSFMIMPSCSEGISGGVLTAMSLGLIPMVTRICGFPDTEVVIIQELNSKSVEASIKQVMSWSDEKIWNESKKVIQLIENKYTLEAFKKSIRHGLSRINCV